tara:strand:+ start:129 stop:578 length:450 start_codon:yes stop_codon:yes gene_type:complete
MNRNPHPKKERHGDCGVRAICLAFDLDYDKVWKRATSNKRNNAPVYCYSDGTGSHYYERSKATATWGLSKDDLIETLQDFNLDVVYKKTTDKKRNIHMYFNANNLPDRCIAHIPRHWVAVKDGAIWDTWDSRGKRPRKLRGYVCLRSDL